MSTNWKEDWNEFASVTPVAPPSSVTEGIFARVRSDLEPSPWQVFSKLAMVHALVGAVTLSLCPQFGLRVFGEGLGLSAAFMRFGEYGCMLACGSFFLGSSLLVASLVLKPQEVRAIRSHRALDLLSLTMLSLGAFVMANAEIVVGFAVAWAVGSLLGGALALEAGWLLRAKTLAKA